MIVKTLVYRMNQRFKITLSGTSCVGKTMLFEALKVKYKNNSKINFIDEAAREFFVANPMPETERFLPETQRRIQNFIIQKEKQGFNQNTDLLICDNSIFTSLAFSRVFSDSLDLRLTEKAMKFAKTYTKIYILDPADVPYKTDSVRQEDRFFRDQVHEALLSILSEYNVEYELLSGNGLDKQKQVTDYIKSLVI